MGIPYVIHHLSPRIAQDAPGRHGNNKGILHSLLPSECLYGLPNAKGEGYTQTPASAWGGAQAHAHIKEKNQDGVCDFLMSASLPN